MYAKKERNFFNTNINSKNLILKNFMRNQLHAIFWKLKFLKITNKFYNCVQENIFRNI